jgi:hypothetical protein
MIGTKRAAIRALAAAVVCLCCGLLSAQPETGVTPINVQPPPFSSDVMAVTPFKEYYCYSSVTARSYVSGTVPYPTNLFLNPRTYPPSPGILGREYLYLAGCGGWSYGYPANYFTGAPPRSQAYRYLNGQLGITSSQKDGYSYGQRVVEPVIIPWESHCKQGGILISAGEDPVYVSNTVSAYPPGKQPAQPAYAPAQ